MPFRKYMHIERFGNDEVCGIELWTCHIMPKIDGTNGSVWYEDGSLHFGSRNRELSVDNDNAGFMAYASEHTGIIDFFGNKNNRKFILYGEWLVKHSIGTYRDDAWKKFYVFDIYDTEKEKYLMYEDYTQALDEYGIDYIPVMSVINGVTYDVLMKELKNNMFLISNGNGYGEGIVIKNYGFVNRYGRTVWAKLVSNEFKEKNQKTFGPTVKNFDDSAEHKIVATYVTQHFVDKVYSKIVNECEGWNSKYIPRLLNTVWHDLIAEELWDILKKYKNPVVDFGKLYGLTVMKTKELKKELF